MCAEWASCGSEHAVYTLPKLTSQPRRREPSFASQLFTTTPFQVRALPANTQRAMYCCRCGTCESQRMHQAASCIWRPANNNGMFAKRASPRVQRFGGSRKLAEEGEMQHA